MKQILSFTLTLVICLSMLCFTALADSPKISAKNIDIHKSEEILLSFEITPKSGLAAGGFELTYDSKMFTYVNYGYGKAFDGGLTAGNNLGDEDGDGLGLFKFAFANTEGIKLGGEMFNVSFKVSGQVKPGEKYEFKLTCTEAADEDIKPFELNSVTATATVKDGAAPSKVENTSRIVGDTSATIEAENNLNSTAEVSKNSNANNPDNNGKNNPLLIIIIAVLAVIIVASIVVIILVLVKKKQNVSEDDVMTKILADDAELDLTEDALADENTEKDNVDDDNTEDIDTEEIDEIDE